MTGKSSPVCGTREEKGEGALDCERLPVSIARGEFASEPPIERS